MSVRLTLKRRGSRLENLSTDQKEEIIEVIRFSEYNAEGVVIGKVNSSSGSPKDVMRLIEKDLYDIDSEESAAEKIWYKGNLDRTDWGLRAAYDEADIDGDISVGEHFSAYTYMDTDSPNYALRRIGRKEFDSVIKINVGLEYDMTFYRGLSDEYEEANFYPEHGDNDFHIECGSVTVTDIYAYDSEIKAKDSEIIVKWTEEIESKLHIIEYGGKMIYTR